MAGVGKKVVKANSIRSKLKRYISVKWILIIIISVIILWLTSIVLLGSMIEQSLPDIKLKTASFFFNISQNKYEAAHNLFTMEAKQATPYSNFVYSVENSKGPFGSINSVQFDDFYWVFHIWSFKMYITYIGRVEYSDGTTGNLNATYVYEEGEWKIIELNIQPDTQRLRNLAN